MTRHVKSAYAWINGRLAGRTKVKASIYYASSSITCQTLRFAGVILSTRLIDANQFGFFAQATMTIAFTTFVREIGQNNALISYDGSDRRFTTFNFQINLMLGMLAAVLLLLVLNFVPAIPQTLRRASPLLAIIALNETLVFTAQVVAQRSFRFRLIGVADIAAVSLYLVTIIMLIHRLEGFLVLICAQLIEGIVRMVLLSTGDRWQFVGWVNGKDLRQYYFRRYAPIWIPQNLLQTASGQMDYMLLNAFGNVYQLGVYERMLQFVRIPCSLSINLLDRVLLASYSKDQRSPSVLKTVLRKARLAVLLAVVCGAGATTFGMVLLLKNIVGAGWATTILHHWWWALPLALMIPLVWNQNIFFQGTGHPKYLLIVTISIMAGEFTLGSLFLIAGYGPNGMFVARALTYMGVFVLQCRIVQHLFNKNAFTTDPQLEHTTLRATQT